MKVSIGTFLIIFQTKQRSFVSGVLGRALAKGKKLGIGINLPSCSTYMQSINFRSEISFVENEILPIIIHQITQLAQLDHITLSELGADNLSRSLALLMKNL